MKTNGDGTQTHFQYLIIGSGPAGLQLAYHLHKAGRDYVVLEAGETPGNFFTKFPRHRKLISINKVYTGQEDPEFNMRMDWNSLLSDSEEMLFKNYSKRYFPDADVMVRYLSDFAEHYDLNVKCGVKIVNVKKDDKFRLTDADGNAYSCDRLIVATGLSPYVPQIPGIELAEQYTEMTVDPDDFTNQRVLVLGKGNSGFETADNLVETTATIHVASPSPLKLAWKSHFVGHLRAVNNNVLETYLLKSQNGLIDGQVEEIKRREDGKYEVTFLYTRALEESRGTFVYDRVLACTGWRFDGSFLDESLQPALCINDRFPQLTSEWESVNIKDLYFAGALMQSRDFKKTMSAFIHGFRFNVQALGLIFEKKYHGQEWPSHVFDATAEDLRQVIIGRLNRSASLWQQPGYFCDLIVVSDGGTRARLYENMPVDYVRDSEFGQESDYYMLTLEYGPDYPDYPLEFVRYISHDEAHLNPQLHPIIRRFNGQTQVAEHHVMEDLEGNWSRDLYSAPLSKFLAAQTQQSPNEPAPLPAQPRGAAEQVS
ncbi:MAG TPA: NAD(P)-binding domain-containing protein [Pyrinomonadaceae bacterium]|nr:NAD(P)-binding domain-containing protein [Pyrinomonadaceae bacterium]